MKREMKTYEVTVATDTITLIHVRAYTAEDALSMSKRSIQLGYMPPGVVAQRETRTNIHEVREV